MEVNLTPEEIKWVLCCMQEIQDGEYYDEGNDAKVFNLYQVKMAETDHDALMEKLEKIMSMPKDQYPVAVVEQLLNAHKDEIAKAGDQGLPMCMAELKAEEKERYEGEVHPDPYHPDYLHWKTIVEVFTCWLDLADHEDQKAIQMELEELIKS